jgi:hypothetical protein
LDEDIMPAAKKPAATKTAAAKTTTTRRRTTTKAAVDKKTPEWSMFEITKVENGFVLEMNTSEIGKSQSFVFADGTGVSKMVKEITSKLDTLY